MAWIRGTVVDVHLAVGAGETSLTTAQDALAKVQALSAVHARPVTAAVKLLLTVGASVAGWAAAGVSSGHCLHTGPAVKAGAISARHGNDLTVFTIESLRACARVVILQIIAAASILAGVAVTLVGL